MIEFYLYVEAFLDCQVGDSFQRLPNSTCIRISVDSGSARDVPQNRIVWGREEQSDWSSCLRTPYNHLSKLWDRSQLVRSNPKKVERMTRTLQRSTIVDPSGSANKYIKDT